MDTDCKLDLDGHQLRNRGQFVWLMGGRFFIFIDCQWNLLETVVLVHPQLGLLCGAALPGFFVFQKNIPFHEKT